MLTLIEKQKGDPYLLGEGNDLERLLLGGFLLHILLYWSAGSQLMCIWELLTFSSFSSLSGDSVRAFLLRCLESGVVTSSEALRLVPG